MAKTKLERITSIENEIRQLENQRKQLLQQHKEQERKERTHRLCKRGGLLESIMPETITLTDEVFKTFLEKALLSDYSRKLLDGLTTRADAVVATNPHDTAQGNAAVAPKNEGDAGGATV